MITKYTKLRALTESSKVWRLLSTTGESDKRAALRSTIELHHVISDWQTCPACQYVLEDMRNTYLEARSLDCSLCPIWGSATDKQCDADGSVYELWDKAIMTIGRESAAGELLDDVLVALRKEITVRHRRITRARRYR